MILNWIYETVLSWLGKDPRDIALDKVHAVHLDAVERTNRATLDQVERWAVLNPEAAQDSLATLAKGKHLPGFD